MVVAKQDPAPVPTNLRQYRMRGLTTDPPFFAAPGSTHTVLRFPVYASVLLAGLTAIDAGRCNFFADRPGFHIR